VFGGGAQCGALLRSSPRVLPVVYRVYNLLGASRPAGARDVALRLYWRDWSSQRGPERTAAVPAEASEELSSPPLHARLSSSQSDGLASQRWAGSREMVCGARPRGHSHSPEREPASVEPAGAPGPRPARAPGCAAQQRTAGWVDKKSQQKNRASWGDPSDRSPFTGLVTAAADIELWQVLKQLLLSR